MVFFIYVVSSFLWGCFLGWQRAEGKLEWWEALALCLLPPLLIIFLGVK